MTQAVHAALTELLAIKEQRISELESELVERERQLEYGVDWMLHARIKPENDSLPVPRLELRILENWDYGLESEVRLVHASRGGRRHGVPLEYSKRSGGGLDVEAFPLSGSLSDAAVRELPGVVNDLCFFGESMGLPAFVVIDETRRYRVTSFRPLRLEAFSAS